MQESKIAVRAIIIHQNKILLVKHKGKSFFSLPGGKLDPGEDMKTGLKRELFEELGVHSTIDKLCFIHEFEYPSGIPNNNIEFFFNIQNSKDFLDIPGGTHTEMEIDAIEWIDINSNYEAKPDYLRKEIQQLIHNSKYPIQYFSFQ